MYQHHPGHPKRRKKRPIHGVKTVAVTRGKSGYGFTISGQHPCVLSCIVPGSPAERAGLKPGDYLVAVNSDNVSKFPHDDVVRIVGLSTGTLVLQVAESYNSSDSSDDEYHHRTKARYPNRVRPRHGGSKHSDKVLSEVNLRDKHGGFDGSGRPSLSQNKHSRPKLHIPDGGENVAGAAYAGTSSRPLVERRAISVPNSIAAAGHPHAKQAIIKSTSHGTRFPKPLVPPELPPRPSDGLPNLLTSTDNPPVIPVRRPVTPASANNAFIAEEEQDDEEDGVLPNNGMDMRVVVGYIGSIEMPSDVNMPSAKLQSIRNAVRRLRVEQKIHTLVLMEVTGDGVKLVNALGTTVAQYPTERVAFSGVCPDDKRFFGIVTLHSASSDEISSDNGSQDEYTSSSSCHVFMVDPEIRAHNIHAQKAKAFGVQCTIDPERHHCLEFPKSALPVILCVSNLYKDRPNGTLDTDVARSQVFADPSRAPQRSLSNSSNSDSGLGFSRDDHGNDPVYVVDMPQEHLQPRQQQPPRQQQQEQMDWSSASFQVPEVPMHHLSPGVQVMPTPKHDFNQSVSIRSENVSRVNTSTSSDDCSQYIDAEKLNVRAMPDPSSLYRAQSSDGLDKHHSAENLRMSMHKLLQARERHASQTTLSSDQESQSDISRSFSASNLQRPVSAPFRQLTSYSMTSIANAKVETVDLDVEKLSPRAILPSAFRSPSAPPIRTYIGDGFDGNGQQDINNIIARFERDKALGLTAASPVDVRRFSEGFALSKKREKERSNEAATSPQWKKPTSLKRQKGIKLHTPLSQSHESLVALENDSPHTRLNAANSVNSIVSHVGKSRQDREDEVGRVAGWAVNFDKLLSDQGGIVVFTEFLKKEFSEENIIFWRTCEQYKKTKFTDAEFKKSKAKLIFDKHLSVRASDAVNVDSTGRQQAESQLGDPTPNIFDSAQLQIYQLMKQDSYSRFLKSDFYKSYLMQEMEGKPLTIPEDDFKDAEQTTKEGEKKKSRSKVKDTEEKEKKRRSLLPWRQKSSKQSAKSDSDLKRNGKVSKDREVNNNNQRKTSVAPAVVPAPVPKKTSVPGPGIDLSTIRKEVQATVKESKSEKEADDKNYKFCRVILPDGSTTVVCAKPGQSIRVVLGKLCDKRNLSLASVDVFLLGSDKPLDLTEDISTLGSKEIMIERRVLFRMDLPSQKSIGVKAKPNRTVRDVFKPILNKYGYRIDNVGMQLVGRTDMLDLDGQVSTIDNQRVVILPKEEVTVDVQSVSQKDDVAHKNSEEHRSSGLFGLLRRESVGAKEVGKGKTKGRVTFALHKTETRRQPKNGEDEKLFELLNKAQSHRLDDQRGVAPQDLELPDFLQASDPLRPSGRESAPPILSSSAHHHSIRKCSSHPQMELAETGEYVHMDNAQYTSFTRDSTGDLRTSTQSSKANKHSFGADARCISSFKTFGSPTDKMYNSNDSFSEEGVVPSPHSADTFFHGSATAPMSPDFDDPFLAEKSLKDIGFDYSINSYQENQLKSWQNVSQRPRSSSINNSYQGYLQTGAVPMASPEQFSPNTTIQNERSEQDLCEALDHTMMNSPEGELAGAPTKKLVSSTPIENNVSHFRDRGNILRKSSPSGLTGAISLLSRNTVKSSPLFNSQGSLRTSVKSPDIGSQGNVRKSTGHRSAFHPAASVLSRSIDQKSSSPQVFDTLERRSSRTRQPVCLDMSVHEHVTFV